MGASGWNYFTPYQEDVENALQALRKEVFEKGEYGQSSALKSSDFDSLPPELKFAFEGMRDLDEEKFGSKEFDSIEELLEEAAEDGTHSILDIARTAKEPEFAVAWPAPKEAIIRVYGTARPTRSEIEDKQGELTDVMELERWQAVFVTVYSEGKPSEIYFEGVSGD
ncbi:MAG TPA: hypothetical protein VFB72_13375 [Verrucomicrobiae bacterium]|nr:hypothetical protein [Verrucomicrobiae bacterium]